MNESADIDVSPGISRLVSEQMRLELSTLELVFLALLRSPSRSASLSAFSEEQLGDAFASACQLVNPAAENVSTRATHAIRRLREQRLLVRVDGAGVLRAGDFALTSLASAIVDFYLEDDSLTPQTLTLLLASLSQTLSEVETLTEPAAPDPQGEPAESARERDPNHPAEQTDPRLQSVSTALRSNAAGASDRARSEQIAQRLAVSASDLLAGIERRARGLDLQQQEFQREVAALLSADWIGAIEQCQSLLDDTAKALRELNQLLLAHAHPLTQKLESIHDACVEAADPATAELAQQLADRVEQLGTWASLRGSAWSEYYEYIHRYLRDVVRLDPARAISQRLRALMSNPSERPYALTVAQAPPLRLLREVRLTDEPPPVIRQKKDREPKLDERPAPVDPMVELEQRVKAELQEGCRDLSAITLRLTREAEASERFLMAGRIAQIVSKLTRPLRVPARPWVRVDEQLSIEERGIFAEK